MVKYFRSQKREKTMHRFFVTPENIQEDTITIEGDDFVHLTRVLRIGDQEVFEVCDGRGTDYHCVIGQRDKDFLTAKILEKMPAGGEAPFHLTLFQGLPKGHKLDEIIQKGTEVGISAFVPFQSSRAVATVRGKEDKKRERWQRIAYEAAKQSKRGIIPLVGTPLTSLSAVLDRFADYDLILLAYEGEREGSLKQILAGAGPERPERIALIVGPEGGFSPEEAAACTAAGAVSVSLGIRILRTETAGVVMAAQVDFFYEQ